MSQRRRGLLLAGLALLLGGLAAADVARREAAVAARIGPWVEVVAARDDLRAGLRLRPRHLRVRRVPARWAPVDGVALPVEVVGRRLAAAVVRGGYLTAGALASAPVEPGAPVRRGERAVQVVAAGSPELVVPGARVDVLVTRERGHGAGATELALQDVEVLAVSAPAEAAPAAEGPRVAATLRVTLRQAVYLTAAQSFARDIRLLPRAAGDRRHSRPLALGEALR